MKIISKRKDYYDYLQGIYGIDEHLVLNRNPNFNGNDYGITYKEEDSKSHRLTIHLLGKRIPIKIMPNNSYEIVYPIEYNWHYYNEFDYKTREELLLKVRQKKLTLEEFNSVVSFGNFQDSKLNIEHRKYALLTHTIGWNLEDDSTILAETPILQDFGFPVLISAEEIYPKIESFLGWLVDNPPIPDKRTNEIKITSKGFDTKSSFRKDKNTKKRKQKK